VTIIQNRLVVRGPPGPTTRPGAAHWYVPTIHPPLTPLPSESSHFLPEFLFPALPTYSCTALSTSAPSRRTLSARRASLILPTCLERLRVARDRTQDAKTPPVLSLFLIASLYFCPSVASLSFFFQRKFPFFSFINSGTKSREYM
jgi:hypothetical protein